MPKTKKKSTNKIQTTLWMAVAVLAVACVTLAVFLVNANSATKSTNEQSQGVVSLGMFEYTINDGKAIKRTDASVSQLRAFLEDQAAKSGCSDGKPAHEMVVAYTTDETQVFIKYGCGAADSPMYLLKINDEWKRLSPTNHFDNFGIANCEYLAQNNISSEIAPVCVDWSKPGESIYVAR